MNLKGSATWAEIEALTPQPGDLWLLDGDPTGAPPRPDTTEAQPGDGIVYSDTTRAEWRNVGPIRGPQGPTGPKGDTGAPGDPGPEGNPGQDGAPGLGWHVTNGPPTDVPGARVGELALDITTGDVYRMDA